MMGKTISVKIRLMGADAAAVRTAQSMLAEALGHALVLTGQSPTNGGSGLAAFATIKVDAERAHPRRAVAAPVTPGWAVGGGHDGRTAAKTDRSDS
jgi:hypothetical protein